MDIRPDQLLCVGRLEEGKNILLLYEYVQRYFEEGNDIRLVVLGEGPLKPPLHPAFEYRGFVSEQEKARAYASSLVLCQPSLNESFSLVVMESWLAGRPVLVHGECAVTRGHVQRSKGGLWFQTYEDFAGALDWFRSHLELATRMGENGKVYVLRNYTWEIVLDRFETIFRVWKGV
jgi:glycosyltransferase involved in cell wall biosynthesis